ncbi:MAG: DUF393 domain-containing protein, partial [Candidatus Eisenbacteria bacterium]|nr:DUF393 domain-containing protein [Candidatus Eisenbacteria bacterium]
MSDASRRDPLDVYFDASCGLCSGFTAWAIEQDRDGRLRALPATSPLAAERTGRSSAQLLETLHAWDAERGVLSGIPAVAAVLERLP